MWSPPVIGLAFFFCLHRERAPISSSLNAIDLYLVVCIFLVFGALMEYAAILLLLKKRRKPKYTIDAGFKRMFGNDGGAATAVPGVPKRTNNAAAPTAAAAVAAASGGGTGKSANEDANVRESGKYVLLVYCVEKIDVPTGLLNLQA